MLRHDTDLVDDDVIRRFVQPPSFGKESNTPDTALRQTTFTASYTLLTVDEHDFSLPATDRACRVEKLLCLARREVLGDQNMCARGIGEKAAGIRKSSQRDSSKNMLQRTRRSRHA